MKNIFLTIISLTICIQLNFAQSNQIESRPSITFILGEDAEAKDKFYTLAKQYYLTNAEAKTDYFVDTCRSLYAVRSFLAQQDLACDTKWGNVNLVLHSNQWTGMSIPVMPDGERTSVESLFTNIQEGTFSPLNDDLVDADTKFNFVSCGLGKNEDLLYAIQLAFGGFDDQQPEVISSEDFVFFAYDAGQQVTTKNLKPYYAFYRTAYKPADLHLKNQFQTRYPNVPIDWLTAIQSKHAGEANLFHTKFNVPINWTVKMDVPAERVNIESKHDEIEFVRAQKDLMEVLTKFDIPIEKFRWQISVAENAGKAQVKIKGKSTVVCVLTEN